MCLMRIRLHWSHPATFVIEVCTPWPQRAWGEPFPFLTVFAVFRSGTRQVGTGSKAVRKGNLGRILTAFI